MVFTSAPCLSVSISNFYQLLKALCLLTLPPNTRLKFDIEGSWTFAEKYALTIPGSHDFWLILNIYGFAVRSVFIMSLHCLPK